MNDDVRTWFEDEMKSEFDKLQNLSFGGEEYSRGVDGLCKMYKVYLESNKIELEDSDRLLRREIDKNNRIDDKRTEEINREEEAKERKLDRIIRLSVDTIGITIPLMFYGVWMNKGFKFEQEGTYTSTTFRNLFNRFRPTEIK